MLHIVVMPIVLVLIVGIHVLMVRIRGVVPPIGAEPAHLGEDGGGSTAAVTLEQGDVAKGNAMEVGK
jgi:ubiquinol-cytochrome c reductase cytochrome b subunit